MPIARRHARRRPNAGDRARNAGVGGRAVTELAIIVVTPTLDRKVLEHRARMKVVGRQVDHTRAERRHRRRCWVETARVAKRALSKIVAAPTLDATVWHLRAIVTAPGMNDRCRASKHRRRRGKTKWPRLRVLHAEQTTK